MTQNEFIKIMLHKPWVNRASSFESCDCFGLVMLYYKHVMGIDLPVVDGYNEVTPVGKCWSVGIKQWEEVEKPVAQGLMFTCYEGDTANHVGIVISPTKVLHCRGTVGDPGKVEIHSIRAMRAIYGKLSIHQLKGLPCQN